MNTGGQAGEKAGGQGQTVYTQALINILDDFREEKLQLESTQKAIVNIAEDAEAEKLRLRETQKAVLNILDDLANEKALLEESQGELARSEAARASLREKEVLLKEIHHRVKNNLQVISSLLSLQARYLSDPKAKDIFNESQNRVQSIALVHEQLYQSPDLSHVSFNEYTASLLDNLFHNYDAADRGIAKVIDVGGVRLAIDVAIPCGLIVNELVTNALKHGFPDGRRGTVWVVLREDPDELRLAVEDDGVGLPERFDARNTGSLGLDLVFTFAEQLDARVDIGRGLRTSFQFRFPKATQ